jgi:hypothetical protein
MTTATKCADSFAGLGTRALIATPSVGSSSTGVVLFFNRLSTLCIASPPPCSAAITKQLPSEVNATWDRRGTGILSSGLRLFVLSSPAAIAKVFRTVSVKATTRVSGPAAARRPFTDDTLSSEEVVGGDRSAGHGLGNKRSFTSPDIALNPRDYKVGDASALKFVSPA